MKRFVPSGIVLGLILTFAVMVNADSTPESEGVRVVSVEDHNALVREQNSEMLDQDALESEVERQKNQIQDLASRVDDLESTETPSPTPTPMQWPSPQNTGPRTQPATSRVGTLTTSSDGQIIENLRIEGRLVIRHDNVLVRDVVINGTGSYMLHVDTKVDGATCPQNVRVEYTEINGTNAAEDDIPIYMECGAVFDKGYVHEVGRTSRLTDNGTVSNSYVHSSRIGGSGAHRGAVGTNGGANNQIIGNVLICEGVGCSAAIPMYGGFALVENVLVKNNLLATTANYCAYGGSVASKEFPQGINIDFIGNHFSTRFHPACGQSGPITGFDAGLRGNEWVDNVWHETNEVIPQ